MRLTKQTNYAIRILIYCTANAGQRSRIAEIAKAYGVSELFLFKILQILVDHGYIKTLRGRYGGIYLAKDPKDITIADIVKITEENFSLAECFDNQDTECPLLNICGLHSTFQKALNAFFDVLSQTTIADLHHPAFRKQLGLEEKC